MNLIEILLPLLLLFALGAGMLAWFTRATARRVEAALPPAGRLLDVAGTRLHVLERGAGPPLLLIHGLGAQMQSFNYGMVERLAVQFRVIAVDRPGSGYSERAPGAAADVFTQAAAIAALLDALQLEPPLVVGHSLGGAVALTLALDHPHRVAGLALVAPLAHAPAEAPAAFRALTIEAPRLRKLFAWTLATPATITYGRALLAQVFAPEAVPPDYATRGGGLLGLRPGAFLAASEDMQALPDAMPVIEARYPELKMPVAVLYGRDDRVLDWEANGQALVEKVAGASLQLVEGGHMLPVTQAALTAAFIEQAAQRVFGLQPDATKDGSRSGSS